MKFNSTEINYNGVIYSSLVELAKQYKIDKGVLYKRLIRGWTLEKAITTPLKARTKKPEKPLDLYYEWNKQKG